MEMEGSLSNQESPDLSVARALNQEAEGRVDQVDRVASSLCEQVT